MAGSNENALLPLRDHRGNLQMYTFRSVLLFLHRRLCVRYFGRLSVSVLIDELKRIWKEAIIACICLV
jgi:hypothetical protein